MRTNRQIICDAFAAGQSVMTLAKRFEISRQLVEYYLKRAGLWERKRPEKPKEPLVQHIYVSRDPCQRCGVRGDIGCRHNPAPISMGAF